MAIGSDLGRRWFRKPATVVLADDHALAMSGLATTLGARPRLRIVGQASNGTDAVALVERHRPAIAVFDYSMPVATGGDAFLEARRWSPDTRFVIISGGIDLSRFDDLLAAGVDGILLKTMPPAEMAEAIESVLDGNSYVHPEIERLFAISSSAANLTQREREVLERIARGLPTTRIADCLGLSAKTVESYRTALMRKLEVGSVAELVLLAMRTRLIDP